MSVRRFAAQGVLLVLVVITLNWMLSQHQSSPEALRRGSGAGAAESIPVSAAVSASADALPAAAAAAASGPPTASAMCKAAMERLIATQPATVWPPPCPLPADSPLRAAYEGPAGSMPITSDYCFAQRYEGELVLDWNSAYIDKYCSALASGDAQGTYGAVDDMNFRGGLAQVPGLTGSTGMVLGSERPWVECIALAAGAAAVWTFEYATIRSTHPQLFAKPTKVMAAESIAGTLPLFDWIACYSSLEHSGLGRYGDAINPDADKEALEQAWCLLKPGGFLILGMPMSCKEDGYIEYNAHRVYGYRRIAYVAEGFELVAAAYKCEWRKDGSTSMIILRRPTDGSRAPIITLEAFAAADQRAGVQPAHYCTDGTLCRK